MSTIVRPDRFKRLQAELEKKDAQLVEVRGALMRILTLQNQNDELAYKCDQMETALQKSHDQNRQLACAFLRRTGVSDGASYRFEFSTEDLEEAYRDVPRLKTEDDEAPGQRFVLDLLMPQRELPPEPAKPEIPSGTPDTPAASGTEEGAAEAPALHAVPSLNDNKEPS